MMTTNKAFIDELTQQLQDSLPSSLGLLRDDIESIVKASMSSTLAKLDLVTREEFDVQTAVLQRSREKLDALVSKLDELEHNT